VTEALLYFVRLHSRLEVDPQTVIRIGVRHSGLKAREIASSSPLRIVRDGRRCVENESSSELVAPLQSLEGDLQGHVKQLLAPLFVLFDFFEVSDSVFEDIVNKFVQGEVV
jgi:hypothetical protein